MQASSKPAGIVAAYTATYFLMAWVQVIAQFDLDVFGYVLYPAFFILLASAPVLNAVNLADQDWLTGTWPSTLGFFILILVYSTLAYFVTRRIATMLKANDSVHA